jgi:hypothetical protein
VSFLDHLPEPRSNGHHHPKGGVASDSFLDAALLHYPGQDHVDQDAKKPKRATRRRRGRQPAKRDARSLPDGARRPGAAATIKHWYRARAGITSGTIVPCLCLDVSTGELTMEMHEQAMPRDWMAGL